MVIKVIGYYSDNNFNSSKLNAIRIGFAFLDEKERTNAVELLKKSVSERLSE